MSTAFLTLIFGFVAVSAIVAIKLRDILSSIISLTVFGTLLVIAFVILQSPDVALTQAVINSGLVTSLFLVAFSRTQKLEYNEDSHHDEKPVHSENKFGLLKYSSSGRILALFSVAGIGWYLHKGLMTALTLNVVSAPAEHYFAHSPQETGAANIVAAILFDYRGFDTLGEATIIFAAASGISLFFARGQTFYSSSGLSIIVKLGMGMIIPFILLYGVYIMAFGHLSPGGGFQGGTVIATVTILLCIIYGTAFEKKHFRPRIKEIIESYSGLAYIAIGLTGLFAGRSFLTNLAAGFPAGRFGEIVSAGFIPLLNIFIGLKVGAGLATIFYSMIKDLDTPEEDEP